MGWKGTLREIAADRRRREREAQKRQRELERRNKEQAKLSAIEQARLEVETYDNKLDVLLSIHREHGEAWDWMQLASDLPPAPPKQNSYNELRTRQTLSVSSSAPGSIEEARAKDEQLFQDAMQVYTAEFAEWEKMKQLAERILAQEHRAYIEALVELSPLRELSDLGSLLHFTVHTAKFLECEMKVNGTQAIPTEIKTLTSSGKVSVKPMPKARFHEIYQDYVCACILRVAREVLAMLPVEMLLVTASADLLDSSTGHNVEQPVLSVAIPRAILAKLDFDRVDPADALENFQYRGDFKASRKSGAFHRITPLKTTEITRTSVEKMGFDELLATVQKVREELKMKIGELNERTKGSALPELSS